LDGAAWRSLKQAKRPLLGESHRRPRGSDHFLGALLGAFSETGFLKPPNCAGYSELLDCRHGNRTAIFRVFPLKNGDFVREDYAQKKPSGFPPGFAGCP
jgi:hypothetical protein